jgi:Kdo2-lipid IVA lauroyltransferase/acyltransferase
VTAPRSEPVTWLDRLQYAALRGLVAVTQLLPFRVAGGIGARVGRLGHFPFGIRRAVVEAQLVSAFPTLEAADRRRIARESYENLGRVALETSLLSTMPTDRVLGLFAEPTGWEHIAAALEAKRGMLLISGHLGNWELGAAYLAARGVPIDAVARHMNNPLVDGYLARSRRRLGVTVLFDDTAAARIPRSVRAGRAVALLADQDAKGLVSTFVPFFGRAARTPKGPAVFALRLGVPAILAMVVREPDGQYRMCFEPVPVLDTGDREQDTDRIVAAYTAQMEAVIRRYPGQYLWQHKRWKRRPPEESAPR